MGQSQSRPHNANGLDRSRSNLYRSRSNRSFSDITVSTFRRCVHRVREYFRRKSMRPVDVYEMDAFEPFKLPDEDAMAKLSTCSLEPQNLAVEPADEAISLLHEESGSPSSEKEVAETSSKGDVDYLDYDFLVDESTIEWFRQNKIVLILRGLPGSGKSTVANAVTEKYAGAVVCSADHYFMQSNGVYRYDATQLKKAHASCHTMMKFACSEGKKMIVVDNTNIEFWEMRPYVVNAYLYSYTVVVVEPRTPWKFNVRELALRNSHSVGVDNLSAKAKRFGPFLPTFFAWFLSPADGRKLGKECTEILKSAYLASDEFRRNFNDFSARTNVISAMDYFSREMLSDCDIFHCTAMFCGRRRESADVEKYAEMVGPKLGCTTRLKITGLFATKDTFGARVQLNEAQKALFVGEKPGPKQYGKAPKKADKVSPVTYDMSTTLRVLEDDFVDRATDRICLNPGPEKRAHVTLGTAEGVRAVTAGLDLLDIVEAEQFSNPVFEEQLPNNDSLRQYAGNLWAIYLKSALSVQAIFTGHY